MPDPSKVLIIRDANNEIETRYVDLTSYEFINSEYYFLKQNDEVYVRPDNASLAFDFGILRKYWLYSFISNDTPFNF